MQEIFQRMELLLGSKKCEALTRAHVAIFGLGGVGSYVCECLARAGIGELTLVDFDEVCMSNINRQCIALHSTIGMNKADVAADRVLDINPECKVHIIKEFYNEENSEGIFSSNFDAVADAIDSFPSKLHLIVRCIRSGIPIFSSMGAGGKLDPSLIRTADISKTSVCPLARKLRRALKEHGIRSGLNTVFSLEESAPLKDLTNESTLITSSEKSFEKRPIGTISYIPAIFGLTLGSMIIKNILK